MATVKPDTFEIPRRALWILVPPLIVMGTGALLVRYGYPLDHLAKAVVQDGHAEAAGRLRTLATWLLLAVACIASILYCGRGVGALAPATARLLRTIYLGLAAVGIVLVASGGVEGGQRLVDRRVVCAAFDLLRADVAPVAGRKETLTVYGPRPPVVDDQFACPSHNPLYRQMWWLNEIQKYLILLLIPALALGMLSCCALPAAPSEQDCRYQVRRLNTHLYVTAAALVTGLLFLSALLHWPGFAFRDAGARSYAAHVDAYILYWGVTYSLFIASYYVPVAMIIARAYQAAPAPAGGRRTKAEGGGPSGDAGGPVSELFGHLKTLAALFAPAIAGLLGGVIQL